MENSKTLHTNKRNTGKQHTNDIPIFRERLELLRKENGFETQREFARAIGCSLSTYQSWIKPKYQAYKDGYAFVTPGIDMAMKICDICHVSLDYLFGRTDYTTVTNENISDITGLNNNAINTLISWNEYEKRMDDDKQNLIYRPLKILNLLFKFKHTFEYGLLYGLQNLFYSNYKIPCYHNGSFEVVKVNEKYDKCMVPQYVVPNSEYDMIKGNFGFSDIPLLTLTKDKNTPWDNIQIALDDNFFKSVAMKQIETSISELHNDFINDNE